MKKCPVCQQSFTGSMHLKKTVSKGICKLFEEFFTDGKGVVRCPHCEARLRKKISIWFIPALVPFIISAILCSINRQYSFLMLLSIVFFMIFYICLPYVPYDQ